MPCYSVQTCNVELNNADHDLLRKALEKEGYKVETGADGKIKSFSKSGVSGNYNGKKLSMSGPQGTKIDTDALKRQYSEQVVEKVARDKKKNGWNVYKEKGQYVFKKQQAGL